RVPLQREAARPGHRDRRPAGPPGRGPARQPRSGPLGDAQRPVDGAAAGLAWTGLAGHSRRSGQGADPAARLIDDLLEELALVRGHVPLLRAPHEEADALRAAWDDA